MPDTQPVSARSTGSVPFLPGYAAHEIKERHHKTQSLTYGPGGAKDTLRMQKVGAAALAKSGLKSVGRPLNEQFNFGSSMNTGVPRLDLAVLETLQDPSHRFNKSARSLTHDEREGLRESARNTYRPGVPPAWLKHDRQVLRFFAYFQEPVHESPKENFRTRPCVIHFYLEDGTMFVTEPKVENSGIPQGAFVKRHRIPKAEGGFYTYEDLKCGSTIQIYSRAFRITDCDDFTRSFFARAVGTESGQYEEQPVDAFRAAIFEEQVRKLAPVTRDIVEGKEYNELSLGGNRRNAKLQQYLENDRKVLSFKCLWDDPTRYGSRMYYTMHYYLSDDTVEMNENLARNSGRDPYPVFWRRSPLRKNPHVSPAPAMLEPEAVLYKPEDLIVGQCVGVYGRDILLYDCDDFTRDFFRKYMDHEQDSIVIKEPEPVHVQLTNPPHTGFGAEDDSLASCLHLTPRPPRRDINKLMNDVDKMMRFEGQLVTERQEDESRRFVIAVHVADGGVAVWEKRQRNSGHTEGKFAAKSRRKNPATGTWFQPNDFQLGVIVEVNGTPFRLVQADEGTLKYMENDPNEFPCADAILIASFLCPHLVDELTAAADQGQCLSLQWLEETAASKIGIQLTYHNLVAVQRAFGCASAPPDAFMPAKMLAAGR